MARRVPVSRKRTVGSGSPPTFGLAARTALGGTVLFLTGSLVAHHVDIRAHRDERLQARAARDWAARLMHGANPTPYGWLPGESATRFVDSALAESGAGFLLFDAADRLVRGSERLLSTGRIIEIPAGAEHADVPGLGRVAVIQVPLEIFGQRQGEFILLKPARAHIPLPPAWSNTYVSPKDDPDPIPDRLFLTVGSLVVCLGTFVMVQTLAGVRLRRMTKIAQTGRRFTESGTDEIARLSEALDTMFRRTHRALDQLGRRETNRRDWLSELSHDLRTPLAALQLRLDNARAGSAEELREAVDKAARDCARIQKLAAGFMDLAELEVTEDFEFEPVMPEELIGQVKRGLTPIAQDAGIGLRVRPSPQPTIYGDGHRLLRALENMVRNAIRHARSEVLLGAERHGGKLHFFVLDDGPGFDRVDTGERLDYENWRGRKHPSGLGLRVAERVARAHGGRLVITNRKEHTLVECVIDIEHDSDTDWTAARNGAVPESDS